MRNAFVFSLVDNMHVFFFQEMERTVHMFETFLWTLKMSGVSSPICSWQSSLLSHSISNCTNYVQSLGVKCSLTHFFLCWIWCYCLRYLKTNQPTRTKQNFRNMLYFPQIKNTTPQLGDFGATETAFASAPLFVHSLLWRFSLGSRPADRRKLDGAVLTALNCLNSGQLVLFLSCFSFPFLLSLSSYFPLWVMDWNLF